MEDYVKVIYCRTLSMISTERSSAGQDIYLRTISRALTGGPSAGHLLDGPSAGHLLEDQQQDIYWMDHQLDIYWRTSIRTSTGGSSTGHLLEDHQKVVYCRTILQTSILDHQQDFYWLIIRHHENSRTGYILVDHQQDIHWKTKRR